MRDLSFDEIACVSGGKSEADFISFMIAHGYTLNGNTLDRGDVSLPVSEYYYKSPDVTGEIEGKTYSNATHYYDGGSHLRNQ